MIHPTGTTMNDQLSSSIQAIQTLLAPALGISAVGLLLLSLNNRYSIIINRIRLLNDERRKFIRLMQKGEDLEYADNHRFMNISKQTEELLVRSKLVRNAILSLQTAMAMFVLTSVSIAVMLLTPLGWSSTLTVGIFVLGMLCVLVGIMFAGSEVRRSFKIVLLEVRAAE
jgi:hypothetical protein